MGGAAGHISHLAEDYSLVLRDLIDIIKGVTDGSIKTYEKFDGVNVVVTWSNLGLRFARGKSDILAGGMGHAELVEKFAGRPGVYDAFVEGFDALEMALRDVPDKDQFFADGERWMSVEICSTKNTNVIQYDSNVIVFHDFPAFNARGERIRLSPLWMPSKMLEWTPMSVDGWMISGPKQIFISNMANTTDAFSEEIEFLAKHLECTLDASLGEVYTKTFIERFGGWFPLASSSTVNAIAHKVLGCDSALHLRDLNKLLKQHTYYQHVVKEWLNDQSAKKHCVDVIDCIVRQTAIDMLEHVCSTMIVSRSNKAEQLRRKLRHALENDDPIIDREHVRLGDISYANAFIEGVVFTYKGKQYKLTGAYAPVNRILGVERFKK